MGLNVIHQGVEIVGVIVQSGADNERRVLVGVHLGVVAFDEGNIVLVDPVVRLHVVAAVALAGVVHAPEVAVDEYQHRRVRHGVNIQRAAHPLHIRVADVRYAAVVAGVTEQQAREVGNALPFAVGGVAVEQVKVQLGFGAVGNIPRPLDKHLHGPHAGAGRAVAADGKLHVGIAAPRAVFIEHFHKRDAAGVGVVAGRVEVVVEARVAEHLILFQRDRHHGDAVARHGGGDKVRVGVNSGVALAVVRAGFDHVRADHLRSGGADIAHVVEAGGVR